MHINNDGPGFNSVRLPHYDDVKRNMPLLF